LLFQCNFHQNKLCIELFLRATKQDGDGLIFIQIIFFSFWFEWVVNSL